MEFQGQYLTYQEYQSLGGTLSQMPFNLLEFEARKVIDKYTFGRLVGLEHQAQETKLCVYELITSIGQYNEAKSKSVAYSSETTDGYSISYASVTKDTIETESEVYKDIVKTYLSNSKLEDGTPYLYRGVGW